MERGRYRPSHRQRLNRFRHRAECRPKTVESFVMTTNAINGRFRYGNLLEPIQLPSSCLFRGLPHQADSIRPPAPVG